MEYLRLGDFKVTNPSMVESFSENVGYQYASHDLATGKPVLQAVGATLSSINIALQLNVMLGHDIEGVMTLIDKMRESGKPQLLVFADGVYRGNYVITDLQTSIVKTAGNGRITYAQVWLSLHEYAHREVVSVVRRSEKNTNVSKRKVITK